MDSYEKRGYLDRDFRLFHLTAPVPDEIGYHYHDFDKILIFINGNADYIIEGKTYHLAPYDIVLVNHHAIHKPLVHRGAPYERIIAYLSPGFLSAYQADDCDLSRCFHLAGKQSSDVIRIDPLKSGVLYQSIRRLEAACLDGGYAKELFCKLLFLEFMVYLNRAADREKLHYLKNTPGNEKVLAIMRHIYEDPAADYTIDQLAARFYLSKYHMMRLFKQETGYTITGYINEKRLLMARELLRQSRPVTEVCYQCGFKNYSAFLRAYKKNFGTVPREDVKIIPSQKPPDPS